MAYDKLKSENYSLLGGINVKASPYSNGPTEFRDLKNLNFVSLSALTKRPGTSLYLGATIAGRITGGVDFSKLDGSSYTVVTANTNAYRVTSSFSSIKTGLTNNALSDFVTFVDRLFVCNGSQFFKFDGNQTSNYSLPKGNTSSFGATAQVGGSLSPGTTAIFVVGYGYLNDAGYYGPASSGYTVVLNGATFNSILYYGMTTPADFGVSAIQLYRSLAGQVDMFGTTAITGSSFLDTSSIVGTRLANDNLYFTLAPRFMEIYNNMLFQGGFTSMPSTIVWSNVGEPEGIDPLSNAEVRTNDGDRTTALKSFAGQLVVTKQKSFHRVVGDEPANISIQEISDQYGCLSNRAIVVFEGKCWFLDSKGIVEYDGTLPRIVSTKIESIFGRMNLSAAIDNAIAVHFRKYNEVWFCIPIDSSPINNTIIVYDYVANAWTTYEGVDCSSLWMGTGNTPEQTVFAGGYTGNIFYFGPSFFSDYDGRAITCMMRGYNLSASGETTERQYRRFYLNVSPLSGSSQAIDIHFRTNFSDSIVLSRTMYQATFQTRLDFGLPAKSISAEVVHSSATLPFQIQGYTFESRFQRNV